MISALRIKTFLLFGILIFLVLIARLFYWQVLSGKILANEAQNQYDFTQKIFGARGKILAVDGSVLVDNQNLFTVFVNKKLFKSNPLETSKIIAPIFYDYYSHLPISTGAAVFKTQNDWQSDLKTSFESSNPWEILGRDINFDFAKKIADLKIIGVDYFTVPSRFYSQGSSSAHIFGILGQDENSAPKGYSGLEGFYDRELSGKKVVVKKELDPLGRPLLFKNIDQDGTNGAGRTLVTSIDSNIQNFVEKYLAAGVETWGAISGTVIVMEPNSGHIIAMASYPFYNPTFYDQFPTVDFKNPAVAETYEPGSIMKPLIVAAGLNEGVITPETRCDRCSGPRAIEGGTIKTFNEQYHPNLTVSEILQYSDNTGMVFVGEKLGKQKLLSYLDRYRFGKLTGIDQQEEEVGHLKTGNDWYPLDLATVTFGQGISVTAMQMTQLFAMLANGGNLVKPQIVTAIIDGDKKTEIKNQPVTTGLLSKKTLADLTDILVSVTEKSPLHFPRDRIFGLNKYRIAAKSGTAQIPIAGKYENNKTVGSAIGFAPADNPKFVVYVKLDEPAVRIWGSDTAGPIFYNIIHDLLLYYNVSP